MNKGKPIAYIITLIFALNVNAQEQASLIQVNDRPVSTEEFKWLYQKNNTGEYQTAIDEYLDLYINLRLKVEAAEEAGIHKRESFKSELAGYRKQLAKNYLVDSDVKERLLDKAYKRYQTEIQVLHILVRCAPDASPEDTLEAYNRAMNIRQRIRIGEPFELVARGASDDPTVNLNGGNLGYLTVFQTPMPFEDAIYNMKEGELSLPVRTPSGYHIIRVQDKRNAQGRIRVAHIMKATPPGSTERIREKAKIEIDSLYNLLQEGADFATLAKKNSDDRMSAGRGGELPWFGSGEMIHEFSVAAFKLLRDNEFTRPVKTVYGWHIIKRLEREAPLEDAEAKKFLESRLPNSYLESQSEKSFTERLKKEYNYRLNEEALGWFYDIADSSFRHSADHIIQKRIPDDILYSFTPEDCSMKEFALYIRQNGNTAPGYNAEIFINTLLDRKVYEHLREYENSILEEKYPEFRYLMNEFYDGILFFEISDSLIWSRSEKDSTGLIAYYNTRKEEFREEPLATARIFHISKDAGKRKVRKMIRAVRRYHGRDNYYRKIMDKASSGQDTLVEIREGKWEKGENEYLDELRWKKGLSQVETNNGTILVDILEIEKERYKDPEDVRARIISGYQEYLEEKWLKELRNKYEVTVDSSRMKKLKLEAEKWQD
jgi:peptidyl-prolyl cis-trans isomerase SurA